MGTSGGVIIKRSDQVVAWCGRCGKPLHSETSVVRKELALAGGLDYMATLCGDCAALPDAWDVFRDRVRAWLGSAWR